MRAWLLGSGGWVPNGTRETTCVLVRDGTQALILDAGTGLRRLVTQPEYLDGVARIDIALTHFHLDHVCGLAYTPGLPVTPDIWAPGAWLFDTPSEQLLRPLRTAPLSPFEPAGTVHELKNAQQIGGFELTARAQPRHWAPTAGLRVGDRLALVTDTAFDPGSIEFARDVDHLLHEAWFAETGDEGDASASEAARVAREANARRLTLVHLDPRADEPALLAHAPGAALGRDGAELY